ncbi:ribokinase [Alkalihalobacterium chitinilyticum]|uniref:Ribokinase n=1 Tax=Alkalihalobacterium chitinilyticum TaxID=2980103 RepID=A0ABT5VD24_9BACI|nr:ribokinase [Alkalihalobacterium chitinilyticum]MDE5413350.1 ribokinase [Alkalihalobacterium chitinilyticum]
MTETRPKITVVGSINMDLITETSRFPSPGETILGENYTTLPGGKGANQAVAAARLGADVSFIGCIGADLNGEELKKKLLEEGIDVRGIDTSKVKPTGIAQITVTPDDNHIIVVPGANYELTSQWVEKNKGLIINCDIVVLQLEIPLPIVGEVITLAEQHGVPVLLNPAPAKELPENFLEKITYFTPNETEFMFLTGTSTAEGYEIAFRSLRQKGIQHVILTRGKQGVVFEKDQQFLKLPSRKVEVVDTTGAGDAFNGALAFGIASKQPLHEAVEFAIKVSAHAVTKIGAQAGMPTMEEVQRLQ